MIYVCYFHLAPPLFITSPLNIISPPERDVTFSCMADGAPPPTYLWMRVDGVLPPNALQSGTSGDLHLFDVTSELSGTYQCAAMNRLGSANASATLSVLGKLEIPKQKLLANQ